MTRHRCTSPTPAVADHDDVDDDVTTTTTSGSYVMDMADSDDDGLGANWRRQIVADIYEGVLV